jgi:hypothetical protein
MTISLKMHLIYAAYGRAMMRAHSLEMKLSTILMGHSIKNKRIPAPMKIKQMTFGLLVKTFIQEFRPSDYLEEELDNMVYFRNELAHRISDIVFNAIGGKGEWHEKIIIELSEIESYFAETDELLSPYFQECYEITNTSKETLLNIAQAIYPKLLEDDSFKSHYHRYST